MEKNKKKIDTEKKSYQLWVRALKHDKDYKEFCLWLLDKSNRNSLIPEKFDPLWRTFLRFGNIHDPEWKFDEWYEWNREKLKLKALEAIEDLTEWIGRLIDETIDFCKSYYGREPSIQELKKWLVEYAMKKDLVDRLLLMVDVNDKTVIEQFKRFVKEERKDPRNYSRIKNKRPIIEHKRIDDIEKYLDVYELREQGLKPRDVIKKHSGHEPRSEEEERNYRNYYTNAKEIIKNAALGLFPCYKQTPRKKQKR